MSRLLRALATGAVAAVALTGLTAAPAAAGVNPALNQPSYYGSNCAKVEYTKATRTLLVKANTRVIVKAGTVHHQFPSRPYSRMERVPKDISFVITCPTTVAQPPTAPTPPTVPAPPTGSYGS